MSEADPRETEKEYFEEVQASELDQLRNAKPADPQPEEWDEEDSEVDTDVELEKPDEPDPIDHSGHYEV